MFVKSDLLQLADEILSKENIEVTENDCWEWQGAKTPKGYGQIKRNKEKYYTHRVILQTHGEGFTEEKNFCCHKCDNPSCVNPDHLFAGSHKDNMEDATEKGRMVGPNVKGEKHHQSKLTKEEVVEIREKYATENYQFQELAEEYDVNRPQIGHIIAGRKWKHADGPIFTTEKIAEIRKKNFPDENEENQGSGNGNTILTEGEVVEMRKKYHNENIYQKDLAEEYGITRGAVGSIVRGDTWKYAGGPTS
ncbi:hypothetical protein OSG_eHP35_00105 [environmental Halophage eHP-35]|nr:hypothetical protein OSG_eHP35_00105 [environmental Halophage eHP-35]